ncbi:hypothetical protein D934_03845 [Xylella fastidiosa subsp. sandyi Ann-1]|uniref:Uncharacterized protein n=1 Tax=Xylella fastidiosa subsp. sandyi Ann-1 TaxID=155920 RepID=A0A060H657_XYLFS|nr:hypothetical protein D934_03845 [Xylella fastidiosa subsp. sandyi Ann-1]
MSGDWFCMPLVIIGDDWRTAKNGTAYDSAPGWMALCD